MVCQDKAAAEESTQLAKEWIEEHASELGLKPTHDRPGFCPRSDNVGRTRAKNGRGSRLFMPPTLHDACNAHGIVTGRSPSARQKTSRKRFSFSGELEPSAKGKSRPFLSVTAHGTPNQGCSSSAQ
jgi:hypothetical protein